MLKVLQRVSIPSIDPLNSLGGFRTRIARSTYLVVSRSLTLDVQYHTIYASSTKKKRFRWKKASKKKNRTMIPLQVSNEYNCIYSCTPRCVYLGLCLCMYVYVCTCAHLFVSSTTFYSLRFVRPSSSSGPSSRAFSSILHFRCPLTARVQQRIVQSLDH